MENIEKLSASALLALMIEQTGNMLATNEEMNRKLERQDEILELLGKREQERKRKDEEAAKALLTALFGTHPGRYTNMKLLDKNAEVPGIPLTNIFDWVASAVQNEINTTDPATAFRPTLGSNPYQTR